jgi:2-dehydro-3-deoxyphosphogalactonate aldolase
MQITDAQTFVVGNPPPHFGGPYWIFVKLTTDGGVRGYGEVYSVPFHPRVVEQMILDVCERHVIGADPFKVERLWRLVYSSGYTQRSDLSLMGVLSGIETACWDIVGKEVNRPVYDLLGGQVHERLRAYTYLYPEPGDAVDVYVDADLAAERAAACAERGFTAVKFDPVRPYSAFDPRQLSLAALDHAEHYVGRIREAVGGRCDLLVGTHGQMTAAGAIRLARRLEPYDPLWFEEPVPPENVEEMAKVARATSIPVATGERLASKYAFAALLRAQAASILQPALGGPIEGAANIQLDACSPNFLIQEGIGDWGGFHAEILDQPIRFEDGYIIPPTRPGIGVELDEEVALRHPYTGDALHLEMHDRPV